MNTYKEPQVTFLVLDFKKPNETRTCLESIKLHVKFPHKIIYLHNGNSESYPYELFKENLCDQIIQTRENTGLGIGTRDLFAASFSEYSIYLQNDQFLRNNFNQDHLNHLTSLIGQDRGAGKIQSISLAGAPCGENVYSERCHLIKTEFYKKMERELPLGYHGAGQYHNGPWREEQIQKFYKNNKFVHDTMYSMFADNGREAIRQNPDGSIWKHFPDTKQLWLVSGPIKEKHVYPKFTEEEWEFVLSSQYWPMGKIPDNEIKDSFHVWN